jgi:pyrophosphatase PpaX
MSPGLPRWPVVVFDLDGTLVDTIGLIVASYQHAFRTVLGRELPEARIKAWIGQPLVRCFQEASPEHADELAAVYTQWNSANTERLIRPYAGVDGLLRDLASAGVRVAVATSKRQAPARVALSLTGLESLVPTLVTMEDTPVHKPDPAPLRLAVHRAGGVAASAVYVGDAVVDVVAAAAAGMSSIGVLWGAGVRGDIEAAHPTALAATVDDLRALLVGWPLVVGPNDSRVIHPYDGQDGHPGGLHGADGTADPDGRRAVDRP